eukprot:698127-Prymnesium_polylepis.1
MQHAGATPRPRPRAGSQVPGSAADVAATADAAVGRDADSEECATLAPGTWVASPSGERRGHHATPRMTGNYGSIVTPGWTRRYGCKHGHHRPRPRAMREGAIRRRAAAAL